MCAYIRKVFHILREIRTSSDSSASFMPFFFSFAFGLRFRILDDAGKLTAILLGLEKSSRILGQIRSVIRKGGRAVGTVRVAESMAMKGTGEKEAGQIKMSRGTFLTIQRANEEVAAVR